MSSIKADNSSLLLTTSNPGGGGNSTTDNDEIKIFECEKHEDDNSDRLSPVIKEEEVRGKILFQIFKSRYLFFSHPHKFILVILIFNFFKQTFLFFLIKDRLNSEQQFHSFFPYFISPYYQTNNPIQSFVSLIFL
jgi:hypothetical protein